MSNHPYYCCRRPGGAQAQPPQPPTKAEEPQAVRRSGPAPEEPPVRRWPRQTAEPPSREDPALHWVHSALSYQNQTLADIKALLERLVLESGEHRDRP